MSTPGPVTKQSLVGPKSDAILRRAGITSLDQLRAIGSVAAYVRASNIEPRVSLNLLWALEGVLTGQHWQQVAREHRTSLLLALEDCRARRCG